RDEPEAAEGKLAAADARVDQHRRAPDLRQPQAGEACGAAHRMPEPRATEQQPHAREARRSADGRALLPREHGRARSDVDEDVPGEDAQPIARARPADALRGGRRPDDPLLPEPLAARARRGARGPDPVPARVSDVEPAAVEFLDGIARAPLLR